MAIQVYFRENKKVDSDAEVIGKCTDGEHEGKICFLARGITDASRFIDQEVYCEIVRVNERSLIVKPISNAAATEKKDPTSLFKGNSLNQDKKIDPDSLFKI